MRSVALVIVLLALSSLPVAALDIAWSLEGRFGISRTTQMIDGLPSDVVREDGTGVTVCGGGEVWADVGMPVAFGTGIHYLSRGWKSTTMQGTSTITYESSDPYFSFPLLARYETWRDRVYVLGGLSLDVNTLPIENDADRRTILTMQAGVGLRAGRYSVDARYFTDLSDASRLEAGPATITESFDGFRVTVAARFVEW